jgi:hypothetical protein
MVVLTLAALVVRSRSAALAPAQRRGLLVALVGAHGTAFSLVGGALLVRYLLPVLPLVVLLLLDVVRTRVRRWPLIAAGVAAAFAAAAVVDPPYTFAPEDTLAWTDFVRLHQEAAARLGRDFPAARVATAWPATDELRRPELGYVSHPLDVHSAEGCASEADVVLVFAVKHVPRVDLLAGTWLEARRERFFGHVVRETPQSMAARCGGRVLWEARRGAQWVALLAPPAVSP